MSDEIFEDGEGQAEIVEAWVEEVAARVAEDVVGRRRRDRLFYAMLTCAFLLGIVIGAVIR